MCMYMFLGCFGPFSLPLSVFYSSSVYSIFVVGVFSGLPP